MSAGYYLNGWLRATSSALEQPSTAARHQKFFYWGDGLEGWRFFGSDQTHAQPDSIQGFLYNDARSLVQVGRWVGASVAPRTSGTSPTTGPDDR